MDREKDAFISEQDFMHRFIVERIIYSQTYNTNIDEFINKYNEQYQRSFLKKEKYDIVKSELFNSAISKYIRDDVIIGFRISEIGEKPNNELGENTFNTYIRTKKNKSKSKEHKSDSKSCEFEKSVESTVEKSNKSTIPTKSTVPTVPTVPTKSTIPTVESTNNLVDLVENSVEKNVIIIEDDLDDLDDLD
jgi:hypothetical protein